MARGQEPKRQELRVYYLYRGLNAKIPFPSFASHLLSACLSARAQSRKPLVPPETLALARPLRGLPRRAHRPLDAAMGSGKHVSSD